MDTTQRFIFNQIKYGLENKGVPEPMTDEDKKRLEWDADTYPRDFPESEWNEWSRKIHNAMQAAFILDTNRLQDKDKINEWRENCIAVCNAAFINETRSPNSLDLGARHFLVSDLLHYVRRIFGKRGLTEDEKTWIKIAKRVPGL